MRLRVRIGVSLLALATSAAACATNDRIDRSAPPTSEDSAGSPLRASRANRAAEPIAHLPASSVRVTLAPRATEPTLLEDESSGVAVAFSLASATSVDGVPRGDEVVYEAAGPFAADVRVRLREGGVEDWLSFREAPPLQEARYAVDVRRVAGVRHLNDVVEFLDAGGAPRLRIAPPFVVDRRGGRHAARIAVEGCAFDDDPRAPWSRPVVPPGAPLCRIVVRWELAPSDYPASLDPEWTSTGKLVVPRAFHSASLLADGRVLVVSGVGNSFSDLKFAELYAPDLGTWATTGALEIPRRVQGAVTLLDGRVLVVGGDSGGGTPTTLSSSELYNPDMAIWKETTPLFYRHSHHATTLLADGRVLVTGSFDYTPAGASNTAELFDPATEKWSKTTPMSKPRSEHTATLLPDGRVLVLGGSDQPFEGSTIYADGELFDPAMETWTPLAAQMARARLTHTATLLDDGSVVVIGGSGQPQGLLVYQRRRASIGAPCAVGECPNGYCVEGICSKSPTGDGGSGGTGSGGGGAGGSAGAPSASGEPPGESVESTSFLSCRSNGAPGSSTGAAWLFAIVFFASAGWRNRRSLRCSRRRALKSVR